MRYFRAEVTSDELNTLERRVPLNEIYPQHISEFYISKTYT